MYSYIKILVHLGFHSFAKNKSRVFHFFHFCISNNPNNGQIFKSIHLATILYLSYYKALSLVTSTLLHLTYDPFTMRCKSADRCVPFLSKHIFGLLKNCKHLLDLLLGWEVWWDKATRPLPHWARNGLREFWMQHIVIYGPLILKVWAFFIYGPSILLKIWTFYFSHRRPYQVPSAINKSICVSDK